MREHIHERALPLGGRRSRREVLHPYAFFLPAFLLVAFVSFVPLGFAILQSVFRSDYLQLGSFAGLSNYYDYLVGRNGLKSIWNSIVFVTIFSLVFVALDEYVAKPWREKRWERQAAAGDKDKQELLRIAKSAKVVEE